MRLVLMMIVMSFLLGCTPGGEEIENESPVATTAEKAGEVAMRQEKMPPLAWIGEKLDCLRFR